MFKYSGDKQREFGDVPTWDDIGEYMTDKRKYTDVVVALEVHIGHISNHLQNIDKHLERQNNKLTEQDRRVTRNTTNIAWLIRILVGAGIISGGGIGIAKFLG